MRKILFFISFLLPFHLIYAQLPAPVPVYALYLVGDAGEPDIVSSPLGDLVRKMVGGEQNPVTLVYLGDNVYPRGVPPDDSRGKKEAETILKAQAGWISGLNAGGIFVPGNHDWQKGGKKGWQYILNQQRVIDSLKNDRITLLPRDGCPGPVEVPLTDQAVLVIIDSQWILHPWDKPGEESSCEGRSEAQVLALLKDVFARHAGKRVIVAAHHPLITYGDHGGVFTFKDHLFPLTELKDNLYVPLPLVGSIYPLYRKFFGDIQDTAHPMYKAYSTALHDLMAEYPGSIHASGHEHALQYIVKNNSYFIVSGSGSKTSGVKQKGYSRYAENVKGFVRLAIMDDGSVDIAYWQADETFPNGKRTFAHHLAAPERIRQVADEDTASVDFAGRYVVARASSQYKAGPWRKKMLGENYRAEWAQQLKVPVFDIGHEKGGLTIVKKGGGMQTLSLRLADSAGREYALRSVEKYPEKAVPEMLRHTFAQDLVQDQISAAHPYGAFVIPKLAEAAGIYHTNPALVYIPDDPRLGIYRKDFANTLALFEERPDDDWSDKAFFGNSKKIVSTSKVLEKLEDDNDNEVDQLFVLRARLFDMLIGDWDRHDDQWRWASFDNDDGKGKLYRPIPRDRDQAFFVNDGVLPAIWSRKWALPKLEGFDETIRWPSGFSFNARYFDRSFLTGPGMDDWINAARHLQATLTDEVIEEAIRSWPEDIYNLHGEEIVKKLKARRDRLMEYALSHYKFLAREVNVMGSDKHELFEVHRLDSGDVEVRVFKINKEGEKKKKLYERVFDYYETKEIRLYGRGDEDRFEITGTAPRSIKVRIIGGGSNDVINDRSHVSGFNKKTWVYDKRKSVKILSAGEVKDRTSARDDVNDYNRKAFQYDRLAPLLFGNYNPDDGLFAGLGMLYQNHGFRKEPFRQQHIALASIAPRTNSYNFLYRGDFTDAVGRWDVEVNADLKVPNFVNNFFGWGNESVFDRNIHEQPGIDADDAIDYYRFRFEEMRFEALLSRKMGRSGSFKIGPVYQRIEIEEPDDTDRFVYDFAETLPYDLFTEFNNYAGMRWQLDLGKTDSPVAPRRGLVWNLGGRSMTSFDSNDQSFSAFESSLSLYYTFRLRGRLTFALRAGGGMNTGTYEFYQAQVLDGRTELRGFRKTRFYGDSKFYTNAEMRFRVGSFHSYLFPASFGILGFHDLGRVWYEDADGNDPSAPGGTSDAWHRGWGGGLWFTPFNLTVLSAEVGHSEEGNLFYLRLGFLF